MSRGRVFFLVLSIVVLLPMVGGMLWGQVADRRAGEPGGDSLYKYLAIFSEVFGLVRSNYVDAPDQGALLAGAMDGVTDALDPFSAFVPADGRLDYERVLTVGRSRSGVTVVKDHGIAFALAVEEGSPGAAAGIQAGDILSEINGGSTRELTLAQIQRLFAGDPGTRLDAELLRQGDPHAVSVQLADYAAPEPALDDVRGVAMLRPRSFGPTTPARVRGLVEALQARGADKLLVDLRGLAGGDGEIGVQVARLFADGELGALAGREGELRRFRGDEPPLWRGSMAVLVDAGTQGAAEVLAAALRDRAGAKLVGLRTFGWAGEREFVELPGGARLHLTTSFYTSPAGEPISKGLAPDLQVDDLQRSFGERDRPLSELILERGIELLVGAGETSRRAA
jgi:carboxyl-terminal processing protease